MNEGTLHVYYCAFSRLFFPPFLSTVPYLNKTYSCHICFFCFNGKLRLNICYKSIISVWYRANTVSGNMALILAFR